MINPETGESLIDFPTYFTYKVVGGNDEAFEPAILSLVERVAPPVKEEHIVRTFSKTNKYITLTLKVYVTTSEEVHSIYEHLKGEERVLWAL